MILEILLLSFLTGSIAAFFIKDNARIFSILYTLIITFVFILYSIFKFINYNGSLISVFNYNIVSYSNSGLSFYITLSFGLTGFTDALIIMSMVVTLFALMISDYNNPSFYGLIMITGFGLSGFFASMNFLFFYVFWEVVIIPMFIIISRYGGNNKRLISLKFFIYTHLGSLFLLLSIFTLSGYYFIDTNVLTFQIHTLMNPYFQRTIPRAGYYFIIFGFLAAFLIKLPAFPLHEWLPNAHYTAPFPGSIMLSGGLLSMGGYGLLGILYPVSGLFPKILIYILISTGIIGIVYFSLTSMFQTNLKRMIAYSSAAEMSFVLVSFGTSVISSGYPRVLDLSGGMYQTVAHSFVISLAFASLFYIYKRTGTLQIYGLGGIQRNIPMASSFFMISMLASFGVPALAGFIGEFSIIVGSYYSIGLLTLIIVAGLMIATGYFLWAVQRSLYGIYNENLGKLNDLNGYELLILLTMLLVSIFFGIYPEPVFGIMHLYAMKI
ncbi:NADH-quinone oxidoreductase subunit M [Picrophilus oshimae]|uniref:NADH dehydrogenase subunit M n=1 Tax=Picrophilus torridus (strain ATCC 700027 / DSM 9790 / JCM 10055 / NBRC 100828 / KAW 2/3) TaxID=1122961 RepID=A0A8G2FVE4_PICTO|nr:NADH-quinone oxidoreductase subunit M [Picrophilus oshimae]SMD30174.1 NADH dehydrogenase subunit M [Picrophilus oshimae DSM 9789]